MSARLQLSALLRNRGLVLVVGGVGSVVIAIGVPLYGGEVRDALSALVFFSLVLPFFVAQGLVADEVRSGVALLWLQKPVNPIRFYFARWAQITALSCALILLLASAGALAIAVVDSTASARTFLRGSPGLLPLAVVTSSMMFAVSSWKVGRDGLIAALLFYGSFFARVQREGFFAETAWLWAVPIDQVFSLASLLQGETVAEPGQAVLVTGQYVIGCLAIGCVGLAFTTRSPIPTETAR